MPKHEAIFQRVLKHTEARASLVGEEITLVDVARQVAIRGTALKPSSTRAEIAGVKKVLRGFEFVDDRLRLTPDLEGFDWLKGTTRADRDYALELLCGTYADLKKMGADLIEDDLSRLSAHVDLYGKQETIHFITGVSKTREQSSQRDQRYLTARDLRLIEMELSSHDPMVAIASIADDNSANDIPGLLRIFAATMWATGARPIEVWSMILLVPRRDIPLSQEQKKLIRTSPTLAIERQILIPIDRAVSIDGEISPGVAAWNACRETGAPAVLMIRSAKQTNANRDLAIPIRLQVLDGVEKKILTMIAAASYLRKVPRQNQKNDSLRAAMDRALKAIGRSDPALKDLKLNLYAMRHSFASRVKVTMSQAEAAALTGHTAKRTLQGYGERNLRKLRSGDNWTPLPDPERAMQLAASWGAKDPAAELYFPPEVERK